MKIQFDLKGPSGHQLITFTTLLARSIFHNCGQHLKSGTDSILFPRTIAVCNFGHNSSLSRDTIKSRKIHHLSSMRRNQSMLFTSVPNPRFERSRYSTECSGCEVRDLSSQNGKKTTKKYLNYSNYKGIYHLQYFSPGLRSSL